MMELVKLTEMNCWRERRNTRGEIGRQLFVLETRVWMGGYLRGRRVEREDRERVAYSRAILFLNSL